jgi:hypothetical protein
VGNGYDAAGNQEAAIGGTFKYDAENRQTEVAVTGFGPGPTYVYDGDGRRVKRTVQGITRRYVYGAGGQLLAEYHNGVLQKEFVYAGSKLLAVEEATQGRSYITTDHLGST